MREKEGFHQIMEQLMERRIQVQHHGLLIEKFQQVFLHLAFRPCQLLKDCQQLLLHQLCCFLQVHQIGSLEETSRQQIPKVPLGTLLLIILQVSFNGFLRLRLPYLQAAVGCEPGQYLVIPAAAGKPATELAEEVFRLHPGQSILEPFSNHRRLLAAPLPDKDIPCVDEQPVCHACLGLRMIQPREQHGHEMKPFQMAENLPLGKEFLLHQDHGRLDEGIPAPGQDCRMVGKTQGLLEECRDCEPVCQPPHQSRFRAEQHAVRQEAGRIGKMQAQAEKENHQHKKQRLVSLVPIAPNHSPHILSARVTRI